MSLCIANDLTPPILTGETRTIGFDFGPILNSGVTISSIGSITCTVHYGTDADAGARLIGSPSIVSSQSTGAASAGVAQDIGTMLDGVTYTLTCYVNTSDGQVLGIETHIAAVAPS
jgi:hypothetical protein